MPPVSVRPSPLAVESEPIVAARRQRNRAAVGVDAVDADQSTAAASAADEVRDDRMRSGQRSGRRIPCSAAALQFESGIEATPTAEALPSALAVFQNELARVDRHGAVESVGGREIYGATDAAGAGKRNAGAAIDRAAAGSR